MLRVASRDASSPMTNSIGKLVFWANTLSIARGSHLSRLYAVVATLTRGAAVDAEFNSGIAMVRPLSQRPKFLAYARSELPDRAEPFEDLICPCTALRQSFSPSRRYSSSRLEPQQTLACPFAPFTIFAIPTLQGVCQRDAAQQTQRLICESRPLFGYRRESGKTPRRFPGPEKANREAPLGL